ncbi:hypothetical protein QUF54_11005 [Candidatus Marithioploca araucensis]|uniref:Uncharacterized protein n=1 Tax=Candidatus Marithioploca araucensis TaxID=70273 RepID=A0ABT7VWB6_9GAMM|nr:hypothetical protein [Candidatus Marithioploca araucensis]
MVGNKKTLPTLPGYRLCTLRVTIYQSDICGLRVTSYELSIRHLRLTS